MANTTPQLPLYRDWPKAALIGISKDTLERDRIRIKQQTVLTQTAESLNAKTNSSNFPERMFSRLLVEFPTFPICILIDLIDLIALLHSSNDRQTNHVRRHAQLSPPTCPRHTSRDPHSNHENPLGRCQPRSPGPRGLLSPAPRSHHQRLPHRNFVHGYYFNL